MPGPRGQSLLPLVSQGGQGSSGRQTGEDPWGFSNSLCLSHTHSVSSNSALAGQGIAPCSCGWLELCALTHPTPCSLYCPPTRPSPPPSSWYCPLTVPTPSNKGLLGEKVGESHPLLLTPPYSPCPSGSQVRGWGPSELTQSVPAPSPPFSPLVRSPG